MISMRTMLMKVECFRKIIFIFLVGGPLLFQFGMTTCVYSESGFTCGHISDPPILFIGSSLFFDK